MLFGDEWRLVGLDSVVFVDTRLVVLPPMRYRPPELFVSQVRQ